MIAAATRLGLITPMRQQLFGVLVSTSGGPESTANALVLAASAGGGSNSNSATEHREREMVQIVMHCLVSEQPFNRFYTRVLGALLNHHRRFGVNCIYQSPSHLPLDDGEMRLLGYHG